MVEAAAERALPRAPRRGAVSISNDLSRAIVASTWAGRAYEVRISDGSVLTVFNNVHDVRTAASAGEPRDRLAARFALSGVYYVN